LRCSAARRSHGRSRRARSSHSACGASACSRTRPPTMLRAAPKTRLLKVRCKNRWGAGDSSRYPTYAAELVALAPDLLLAGGGTAAGALPRVTRGVPIVFVEASDPVNRGLVASLSRPGGNTTGFILFEYGISGKWLELLKEIAPRVIRAIAIRDPSEF